MVGECAGNCSTLWLDHAVSVHTEGGSMADFRAERGNVQRFLQLMALYSTSASATVLDALAAQLRG